MCEYVAPTEAPRALPGCHAHHDLMSPLLPSSFPSTGARPKATHTIQQLEAMDPHQQYHIADSEREYDGISTWVAKHCTDPALKVHVYSPNSILMYSLYFMISYPHCMITYLLILNKCHISR